MTTISSPYYVISANHLFNGEVVFWKNAGEWSYLLADAYVFDDKGDAEDNLRHVRPDHVVGEYLITVRRDNDRVIPIHLREAIRASGPTNYHHGKQSDRHVPSLANKVLHQKGE